MEIHRLKTIYLLRHAKSSWKEADLDDFERPLAKRGRRAAKALSDYVADAGILPAQILCSPSKRTRETLSYLEKGFKSPVPVRFEKGIYAAEAGVLLRRIKRLSDSLPSVMIIGHNPGLERLALMLGTDESAECRDRLAAKYPTGALAVLVTDAEAWRDLGPGGARLGAFVRPRDLPFD